VSAAKQGLSWADRTIIVGLSTLTLVLPIGKAPAHAVQVEAPETTVSRVEVVYAEPVPTERHPRRHYFETNDGAAYRYITYGTCSRADLVPDRVCRTVFWYAR
jgi:hypothetical protein